MQSSNKKKRLNISEIKCGDFIKALSSKDAIPGGGGAAAFGGAIGIALSNMVGNLTIGKKKYESVEREVKELVAKGEVLISEFMTLIDKDAIYFEPLSKAYGLPKDTQEQMEYKKRVIDQCCKDACLVPMEIIRKAYECIILLKRMGELGSIIAISDVGCGAAFLKATLAAAKLNVLINFNYINDKDYIATLSQEMQKLSNEGDKIADEIAEAVIAKITNNG